MQTSPGVSPAPIQLATAGTVTFFAPEPIVEQLRAILDHLDTSARLAEGGYHSCHAFARQARIELADLIAELSE